MRVSDWRDFIAELHGERGRAMTIGVFDGLHLGHQALIRTVLGWDESLISTVITFTKNPKGVLRPSGYAGDICTLAQKLELLEALGVVHTVLIDFSEDFSKLGGRDFIELLAVRGNLRFLAVGADFKCGHKLDTDAELIRTANEARGIPTRVMEPVRLGDAPVSSSRIRAAIGRGNIAEAAALLGRNVELDLSGIHAAPRGNELSFDFGKAGRLSPPDGRYPICIYEEKSPKGIRAEASVRGTCILIPPGFVEARRVEFIP